MRIQGYTVRDRTGRVLEQTGFSTPTAAPVSLPLRAKAQHLRAALGSWARSGFKKAPRDLRHARLAVCVACEYWNAAGNLGLGECKHPACGCTKLKAALATATCPAGKWPS